MATKIHGQCILPDDYVLMVVPQDSKFEHDIVLETGFWKSVQMLFSRPFQRNNRSNTQIACNYNVIKIFVSLAQLSFAIITVYSTKGDQISKYGYAAFGLTVIPYAWMSLVNLVGNFFCPEYPAIYIVESDTLNELRAQLRNEHNENIFHVYGTVGKLTSESERAVLERWNHIVHKAKGDATFNDPPLSEESDSSFLLNIFLSAIPIVGIGVLTKFHPGASTKPQRTWLMVWLIFGIWMGVFIRHFSKLDTRPVLNNHRVDRFELVKLSCMMFVYGAPAIGGLVVVGQMIKSYGVCFGI
jgi:hypothetical protein